MQLKTKGLSSTRALSTTIVKLIDWKWGSTTVKAFNHIHHRGHSYDPVYIDSCFSKIDLYYNTSKGLCTIFKIPFNLPPLEEIAFARAAREGDQAYIQKLDKRIK